MVADVVEALLGTIYLEAGWAAAQRLFDDFILRQVRGSKYSSKQLVASRTQCEVRGEK